MALSLEVDLVVLAVLAQVLKLPWRAYVATQQTASALNHGRAMRPPRPPLFDDPSHRRLTSEPTQIPGQRIAPDHLLRGGPPATR